uniref:EGF-like domain-containing protein n=1 Tax=Magallana gigas TaxID=29159 RepID=A0A8W8NSV0_MAGGI
MSLGMKTTTLRVESWDFQSMYRTPPTEMTGDCCLTLGYYGENCSTPCPENCKGGDCDIVDGTCVSCVPGYSGSMCNIVCGACYEKEQCDFKNGTCPNGCEDGYKGRQCKTVCNNNTYGPNCSRTCGHCLYLYGEKCNHVTGQCPRGCASGFQGDLCVESRSEFRNTTLAWSTYNGCLTLGYYGENCSTPCPENCKGGDCDNVDGTCVSCVPGYSGSMCNIVCNNNTYGPNCSMTCGHCLYLYGEKCNHVTGQCPRGCVSGFQGDLCVESRSEFRNTTLAWSTYNATDKFKNKTLVRPMNDAYGPPVLKTTVQVPFYSIITVVVLFSVSALLNLFFISRQVLARCRNREEKVDESVEKPNTIVNSIDIQENEFSTYQELEHADQKLIQTLSLVKIGCLTLGYYGEKCSTPCPKNCKGGDCDIVDGTCISCVHGYTGSICNKVCNNNTYGPNCSRTCGHCLYLYGEKCNHVTGQCPRGCASGFQGDLCVESRSEFRNTTLAWSTYNGCLKLGYYGENCSTPCPENCENGDCDIVDGTCISCVPGYKGSMCNKACEGKYGMNCSKVCGACYEKEQCDYKNGTCPSGCEDGYNGRQCKTVCNNNTYGPNCSMTCGHCIYLYGEKCNHVTGQCPRGCAPGFQGDLCVESIDEFKNKTTVAWPTYNGCLKVGYYGENCSTPCPENCENGYCDIVDGTCISCVPGYKGSMCNKVCNNNTYGPNCSKTCGHCIYLYGEKCNHVTGQCPRGCASGFQGDLCVESRDEFKNKTTVAWPTFNGCLKLGYYGENCSTPCPENCENGDCDIVDGTCNSCVPGYRGSMCNKACEGKYGMNCSKVCGACYEKEQCDYKNGTCPSGCEDGYKGRQCKTVCNNNTYGPNCSRTCGHCVYLYGEKCNHVTGQCPRGCAPGFQGDLCVESRDEFKNKTTVAWPTYTGCLKVGYYGENCSTPCPENCENGDCDIVDGICISCVPGYRGYMCNKVCNNNTYGPNCSMTCGHCVYLYGEKCNHVTGQCPRGCASGFQGDLCVESRDEFKNMTTVAWPTYTGCLKEGYYGENCSTLCPENCENGDCDIVDGTCISCVPGYRGSMCNKVCNNNTYGPNCSRTCGHCLYLYGEKCNHVTGQCPRGCASGFQGDFCVESRDEFKNKTTIAWPTYNDCLKVGYFGENCSTPCPENCENGDCDIVDGTCISCVPGYRGSMCNKVCNSNTYGPNCSRTCGHCLYLYGEKCNHVTGQCPRGCASGFQGDICVESRDEFKNKTTVAWPTYNAHGPSVSQSTVQVPVYSIVTVVVLFSGSAILNLIFISRKALLRCRNRDEKVDESVEKSYTYVDSINVLENGCAAHQELEHFDKKENDDIYTYVE